MNIVPIFESIGGMEMYDKVGSLLECGQVNSPEAFKGLMENLENAMTV